jgi:hypothetical protein
MGTGGRANLWKLHHQAQTIEAKRDFYQLANKAINTGRVALVCKYFYPEGAGWRVIDRHIVKLRKAIEEVSDDN